MSEVNPLLRPGEIVVDYAEVKPEHIVPAIDQLLGEGRALKKQILDSGSFTYDGLVLPFDEFGDRLWRAWGAVSHLLAVCNTEELRKAHKEAQPKITEYYSEQGQDLRLHEAVKAVAGAPSTVRLSQDRRKVLDNWLRDFRLSGIDLPEAQKTRLREINARLAQLSTRFSDNVLDATHSFKIPVSDAARLKGIPEGALAGFANAAKAKGLDGWLIGLDIPSYMAVMNNCEDRELRAEMYRAYTTRASDQGPEAGKFDNSPLMDEILALRTEKAKLLGFSDYTQLSLATKMAPSPDKVLEFLGDLAVRSRTQGQRDVEEAKAFAAKELGIADFQPSDAGFVAEKMRQKLYSLSQEELRPWFPEPKVMAGLFRIIDTLFGVQCVETKLDSPWHPSAQLFRVERQGQLLGFFTVDLYAREGKQGGAWVSGCRSRRRRADGSLQLPVANVVCNFQAPHSGQPGLLTHSDVVTLFHEFGHCLHNVLTQCEAPGVAGVNGVEWDAVELPSQLMENWCWRSEGLSLISGHWENGSALPQEKLERLLAARNFQSGLAMLRQLEFAFGDFRMHREVATQEWRGVIATIADVRSKVAVLQPPEWNRFFHAFTHLFSGGYAAGYYSYKWAEVLSADAFSRFEEEGVLNPKVGADFAREVLEIGGSRPAGDNFRAFRGRDPSTAALLRHSGITG
ncbi:MAG: hypothetical protein RL095_1670 [Verrucomicrobiota bacterium]|jgi:oligopeptidase A